MCGFAGYFAHAASGTAPARKTLVAMRDRMRARGPDGDGLWISPDERVGLAHRRLSIIDLSDNGAQPMADAIGRYTIVFNGEIYNFGALRADLEARGARFASASDTEVLLHLYARHGTAMLPMLRGMFALAIWDSADRSMLLARDPYGIKPLYYATVGGCVRFASQVKALLMDPAISRDPSPAGLAAFHITGAVVDPFTIYREICACPAGGWIRIDRDGVAKPVRFARVAEAIVDGQDGTSDHAGARAALLDSVRHHLVADVEVGAFLSGGIDSGALIGLMRDCGQQRIRAVTLGFSEFEGLPDDEIPGARAIADLYGVDHHIRRVDATEFAADLGAIFDAMDQPSVDGINTWFVSKACREFGLKVALSGLGGDELLAGYSTFQTVPQTRNIFGKIALVPGAGSASRLLLKTLAPQLLRRNPKMAGVLDYSKSWAGAYLLRRAVLLPFELDGVMDAGMARDGLAELDLLGIITQSITPEPGSNNGRVTALESCNYMRNQLLRDADWAGMAHSLEIRVPLVDFTLLQQLAPMLARMDSGSGKRLLAHAPSVPLPDSIAQRPKTGFSVPVGDWQHGYQRHVADRRTSRDWARVAADRYFDSILAPVG